MQRHVALLRAVNVGGSGRLPMADLVALCEAAGFAEVRTYIASGNVVLGAETGARAVQDALEARLAAYAGRPVRVFVRSAGEMRAVVRENPFPDRPGNRVVVLFLDDAPGAGLADEARGRANETLRLGRREVYVHYPDGQGRSKLVVPGVHTGRNMNTVAKLADMAAG